MEFKSMRPFHLSFFVACAECKWHKSWWQGTGEAALSALKLFLQKKTYGTKKWTLFSLYIK